MAITLQTASATIHFAYGCEILRLNSDFDGEVPVTLGTGGSSRQLPESLLHFCPLTPILTAIFCMSADIFSFGSCFSSDASPPCVARAFSFPNAALSSFRYFTYRLVFVWPGIRCRAQLGCGFKVNVTSSVLLINEHLIMWLRVTFAYSIQPRCVCSCPVMRTNLPTETISS